MIGTIRKHSSWLWFIIIAATIVSFVVFFSPSQRMGNGVGGNQDFGTIYGKKITQDNYVDAKHDVELYFLFHYGVWPEKNPQFSAESMEREIYIRMLLLRKAHEMGIFIGDDQVVTAADAMLHSPGLARALGVSGQSIPFDDFVKQILPTEDLTSVDFESFVRHELVVQQMLQALGLPGRLVTPQEAADIYQREHRELSTQIVFFSAANYLSQVIAAPDAVAQFYTNYLAAYRLPERVQINYVAFDVTNFMAGAEKKFSKTNLDAQAEALFEHYGTNFFAGVTSPDETMARFREAIIHKQALADARQQANDFATEVFNLSPASPENLGTVAKQKGLAVRTTVPFDAENGPGEFAASPEFTKAAFQLSADEPLSEPLVEQDTVYVIALARQLPSEIPSLDDIRTRVTKDYQLHEATDLAQRAGTNFDMTLAIQLGAGRSFASICAANGLQPQTLPPFSLSTQKLPELDARLGLDQLKSVALSTPPGHVSGFEPTDDGGFIVYVQSQLPVDQAVMNSEMPQYIASLRRARENEAFNEWLGLEANRELQDTPLFRREAAAGVPK
jgi:hypothetical protein